VIPASCDYIFIYTLTTLPAVVSIIFIKEESKVKPMMKSAAARSTLALYN
jgi:hypothetical protein